VVKRTLCTQGEYFSNRHSLGHLLMVDAALWDGRCVLKGSIVSNRRSLGHLLIVDAVLWDVRCAPARSFLRIVTLWCISSLWTLWGGTDAVFSRGLCSQRKFLYGQSLGNFLMAHARLWDVRCVPKGRYPSSGQKMLPLSTQRLQKTTSKQAFSIRRMSSQASQAIPSSTEQRAETAESRKQKAESSSWPPKKNK
jgi:hypothetical protein